MTLRPIALAVVSLLAAPGRARHLHRHRHRDPLGPGRQHRMASAIGRARHVDTGHLGRPNLCDVSDRHRTDRRARRAVPGDAARCQPPERGRGDSADTGVSSGRRPRRVGASPDRRGPHPGGASQPQPGDTQRGDRRRQALRLVRHRSAGRPRSRGTRDLVASHRPGLRAVRRPLGSRQFAPAIRRSSDSSMRPSGRRLSAGARYAHRRGTVEGRPWPASPRLQHAARRAN